MRRGSLRSFLSDVSFRQLRQFDEAILRRLRVDERDAAAGVAEARHFVGQREALRLELGERLVDVLDLEADVIEAPLPLRDHALVLAVGALAGDELDHRFADVIERELALVVLLRAPERDAEAALPELAARLGVLDHDPDMLDTLDFHNRSACVLQRFSIAWSD